jgi:hypothetical protein
MLARFDDAPAPELPESSTAPSRPAVEEPVEAAVLPEPEPTPRAERSAAEQPFAPETMFGTSEKPRPETTFGSAGEKPAAAAFGSVGEKSAATFGSAGAESAAAFGGVGAESAAAAFGGASDEPSAAFGSVGAEHAAAAAFGGAGEKSAAAFGGAGQGAAAEAVSEPEVGAGLRPSPPPPGVAATLAAPSDSDAEPDVASIDGRSGRGRRRTPKLGDLLTEALRAYQDVRDADEAQDSLAAAAEPSELGATELGSWLGTGTEPVGSIDPPSWRPGSSTRSFGVARHSSGDDAGDSRRQTGAESNPPTG